MTDDQRPPFEIIEESPPKPKAKPKRRPRLPYLPWRWMGIAFAAGIGLIVALLIAINPTTETRVYIAVTASPTSPPLSPQPLPGRTRWQLRRC